jgi:hypothetical protein
VIDFEQECSYEAPTLIAFGVCEELDTLKSIYRTLPAFLSDIGKRKKVVENDEEPVKNTFAKGTDGVFYFQGGARWTACQTTSPRHTRTWRLPWSTSRRSGRGRATPPSHTPAAFVLQRLCSGSYQAPPGSFVILKGVIIWAAVLLVKLPSQARDACAGPIQGLKLLPNTLLNHRDISQVPDAVRERAAECVAGASASRLPVCELSFGGNINVSA